LQSKAIKDYLKYYTKSLPSPTDCILNQLVKGCQIAINSTVILAEENRQLQAENKKQKKKRTKKKLYIAQGGILTIAERLQLARDTESQEVGRIKEATSEPKKYILSKYSIYKSLFCN
jgi:hypothetical protein